MDYALERLGKSDISLKEAQYEALKNIVYNSKDAICIPPTGFRKSLIYQMLPDAFDYFHSKTEIKPFFNSQ